MKHLAPLGAVYQAGTLSGNPVAVACGLATLKLIRAPGFYERLGAATQAVVDGLAGAARGAASLLRDHVGGMFGIYFAESVPASYAQVMARQGPLHRFFHAMLDRGVYLAPSAFEPASCRRRTTARDRRDRGGGATGVRSRR